MLLAVVLLLYVGLYSILKLAVGSGISGKKYYKITWIFILGMGILAFHFHPAKTGVEDVGYDAAYWDLSRYYLEIIAISKHSFQEVISLAKLDKEPLRFPLWYMLSLLPSLEYFQLLSVMAACSMLFYCTKKTRDFSRGEMLGKEKGNYGLDYSVIIICVLSLFAMINYLEMINTGRYIFACMIAIIGIVQIYQHNRKMIGYTLIGIAGLLHIAMWGVLLMVLFNDSFMRFEGIKLFLLGLRICFPLIGEILNVLPLKFFHILGDKMKGDLLTGEMTFSRVLYESVFITFSICSYYFIHRKKMILSGKMGIWHFKMLNLLQLFLVIMIGGAESNISYRLGYLVAMMSPFFLLDNPALSRNAFVSKKMNIATLMYCMSCLDLIMYGCLKGLREMEISGAYFG